MKFTRTLFTALALTLAASHAHALGFPFFPWGPPAKLPPPRLPAPPVAPASVPEINPAMATGAFALLAGTGLILRRGRVKA